MAFGVPDSIEAVFVKGEGSQGGYQARFSGRIRAALQIEAERLFVWSPLFLTLGIWLYFCLPQEPPWGVAFAGLGIGALGIFKGSGRPLLIASCLVVVGFSAAELRTDWVSTPLLRAYEPKVTVTGYVGAVERRGKNTFSLLVDVTTISGVSSDEIPRRVQILAFRQSVVPRIGDLVEGEADLRPLPRPVAPGFFDYGRQLYFQSVGATGRSWKPLVFRGDDVPARYQLDRWLASLRDRLSERISAAIGGPLGSFAQALVTGERAAIPKAMNNSLQVSGLYHILSISGFHMSLVAGGAFWMARALLALSPALALRYPIKKWAAGAAIAVGAFYMLLADSGAATERSFVMIAIVFFSVLVDRPALSLHNLAVAALVILLWQPEQAMAAGFQMSFMAVMGLAGFFAWWQSHVPSTAIARNEPAYSRWLKRGLTIAIASLGTSLIAGAMSGIPAAYHFGRIAPFGLVANALALPIVSFVVMPSAVAGIVFMPFGLDGFFFEVMGWGLELVMGISDWIASWPLAGFRVPQLSQPVAILMGLAAAMLALSVTLLRALAIPLLIVALTLQLFGGDLPVLLIDEQARNPAILTSQGYVPVDAKEAHFAVTRWLQKFGEEDTQHAAAAKPGWNCANGVCTAQSGNIEIAYLRREAEALSHCVPADVLIAAYPLRRKCKGRQLTIDRFDVWRNGAVAIFHDGQAVKMVTVTTPEMRRPWQYQPRPRSVQSRLQQLGAWPKQLTGGNESHE